MADECCSLSGTGSEVCDLPLMTGQRATHTKVACPVCGKTGKPVEGQTVKATLAVSLREVRDGQYLFCRTQTCPVVYYAADGGRYFTVEQVRERVYQKAPQEPGVSICYCFRHTVGQLTAASPATRQDILDDINAGIQAGQCACDLRNPQGSCCLGNMRALTKQLASAATAQAKPGA